MTVYRPEEDALIRKCRLRAKPLSWREIQAEGVRLGVWKTLNERSKTSILSIWAEIQPARTDWPAGVPLPTQRTPWTKEQVSTMQEQYSLLGPDWGAIKKALPPPAKTESAVRNKWKRLNEPHGAGDGESTDTDETSENEKVNEDEKDEEDEENEGTPSASGSYRNPPISKPSTSPDLLRDDGRYVKRARHQSPARGPNVPALTGRGSLASPFGASQAPAQAAHGAKIVVAISDSEDSADEAIDHRPAKSKGKERQRSISPSILSAEAQSPLPPPSSLQNPFGSPTNSHRHSLQLALATNPQNDYRSTSSSATTGTGTLTLVASYDNACKAIDALTRTFKEHYEAKVSNLTSSSLESGVSDPIARLHKLTAQSTKLMAEAKLKKQEMVAQLSARLKKWANE